MTTKARVEVTVAGAILILLIAGGVMLWMNAFSKKNSSLASNAGNNLYSGEIGTVSNTNAAASNNTNSSVSNVNATSAANINLNSNTSLTNTNVNKSAPASLKIEDTKAGTGKVVKSGDTVTIHYSGTLANGTKFDSSYDRGQPFTTKIGVGDVIKGWDEGVVGMKVGGKRKLTIPPELGYGSNDLGVIPPNSTLIFELELVDVK